MWCNKGHHSFFCELHSTTQPRFQTNCILNIQGTVQSLRKIYKSVPCKKVINKFMIIRYRLQSIYYVYSIENKKKHAI